MTKKTLLPLLGFVIIAVIIFVLFVDIRPKADSTLKSTPPPPPTASVTVQMTAEGFSPSKITVKPGTAVKFVNQDSRPRWPASNIHPSHDIFPDFDPRQPIPAGQDWTFQFSREGIWRYHDHLLPDLVGTITVE